MKKLLAIVLASIVLGGVAGYGVYAKACELNGGKCCGRCQLPPQPK